MGYLIYSDMTLIVGLLFLGFENGTIIGDLAEADGNALMEWPTLRDKHIYGSLRSHDFTPGAKMEKKIDEGLIECVFAVHYGLLA